MTHKLLSSERFQSLKTKNKKINNLRSNHKPASYSVPVINLTDVILSEKEISVLKFGLHHSFVDKNKYIKQNLGAEFESLYISLCPSVPRDRHEDLKHFLRSSVNRFTSNIYSYNDNTFRILHNLSHNQDIAVLQGDKDSSVVLLPKTTYTVKLQSMIDEGIKDGKYEPTSDITLTNLKSFQDFIYRNFKNNKDYFDYSEIRPSSSDSDEGLTSETSISILSFLRCRIYIFVLLISDCF